MPNGSRFSCGRPVPLSINPAAAAGQLPTGARRPCGAARQPNEAAVSCNDGMDSSRDSRGIECQSRLCAPECPGEEESEMKNTAIAVDLAKSVFEVAVSQRPGKVVAR